MNIETLEDLFRRQLQHAYYVERLHAELLAEMATTVSNDDLADQLEIHHEETNQHRSRLEELFDALGQRPHATRTRAIDGLVESWNQYEPSADGPAVPSPLELALTAERLEIRAYESLVMLAGRLAYSDAVVEPLETTLEEERETVQTLEALESEIPVLGTVSV